MKVDQMYNDYGNTVLVDLLKRDVFAFIIAWI